MIELCNKNGIAQNDMRLNCLKPKELMKSLNVIIDKKQDKNIKNEKSEDIKQLLDLYYEQKKEG